jgi:hypothetical protein
MEGIVFETVCQEIKTHRANPTTLPIRLLLMGNGQSKHQEMDK